MVFGLTLMLQSILEWDLLLSPYLFIRAPYEFPSHVFISILCMHQMKRISTFFFPSHVLNFWKTFVICYQNVFLLVSEMLYGFLHRGIWVLFNMVMCILASYAESSTNFVGKGYTSSVGDIYNSYVCGVDPGGAICVWFVSCPVLIALLIVRFLLPYSIKSASSYLNTKFYF
jgi:hypothetical protein